MQDEDKYKNTDIAFPILLSSKISFLIRKIFPAALLSKYIGKQFLDQHSNSSRQIEALSCARYFTFMDIKTKGFNEIGLNFKVNNLLDAKYVSNGYTYHYYDVPASDKISHNSNSYFPQAGINYMAG